jgi:S1-C subfamily serine protease
MHATEVSIQPERRGDKIEANVEMVAPDADLAVLSIKDAKFFDKHPALPRARKLPKVQDNVSIYGFPIGGNGMAITKGAVARIDYWNAGQWHGLVVQVNASINPGNSGGPALVGEQMIGLVFSRGRGGEGIGYLIPNEEIDQFLDAAKEGRYTGKPLDVSGALYQRCENPALRSFLKLDGEVRGVLVLVPRSRPALCPFEEFDVLTRIAGQDIDNDGMVQQPGNLRLQFECMLSRSAKNGKVPITVVRKGQRFETELPVSTEDTRLVLFSSDG